MTGSEELESHTIMYSQDTKETPQDGATVLYPLQQTETMVEQDQTSIINPTKETPQGTTTALHPQEQTDSKVQQVETSSVSTTKETPQGTTTVLNPQEQTDNNVGQDGTSSVNPKDRATQDITTVSYITPETAKEETMYEKTNDNQDESSTSPTSMAGSESKEGKVKQLELKFTVINQDYSEELSDAGSKKYLRMSQDMAKRVSIGTGRGQYGGQGSIVA